MLAQYIADLVRPSLAGIQRTSSGRPAGLPASVQGSPPTAMMSSPARFWRSGLPTTPGAAKLRDGCASSRARDPCIEQGLH